MSWNPRRGLARSSDRNGRPAYTQFALERAKRPNLPRRGLLRAAHTSPLNGSAGLYALRRATDKVGSASFAEDLQRLYGPTSRPTRALAPRAHARRPIAHRPSPAVPPNDQTEPTTRQKAARATPRARARTCTSSCLARARAAPFRLPPLARGGACRSPARRPARAPGSARPRRGSRLQNAPRPASRPSSRLEPRTARGRRRGQRAAGTHALEGFIQAQGSRLLCARLCAPEATRLRGLPSRARRRCVEKRARGIRADAPGRAWEAAAGRTWEAPRTRRLAGGAREPRRADARAREGGDESGAIRVSGETRTGAAWESEMPIWGGCYRGNTNLLGPVEVGQRARSLGRRRAARRVREDGA